jgi:integrative and conjugative element protein (TIGR02256 family)
MAAMEEEAERGYPDESGGALLGYFRASDRDRIQVCEQVGPGPKAIHKRHRFEPDGDWQAERIAEGYARSGRINTYLGDWHSHPGGGGKPSALDRSTAREIAQCTEARLPHPLILIVFGGPTAWEVAAYRRGRWRLQPSRVVIL